MESFAGFCVDPAGIAFLRKIDLALEQPRVVVMISGAGSNMKAIVAALAEIHCPVTAVISNRPDSAGLGWATQNGIDTKVVDHKAFTDRDLFDEALLDAVRSMRPDWVFLAGFMRVLRNDFVAAFVGKLVNIHPSLLPAFTGLNTHQRAIDAGVKFHGATVHWVNNQLDAGAPIIQGALRVTADDTKERLQERVQGIEHQIYRQAVLGLISQNPQSQMSGEHLKPLPAWQLYD
jgi:phosphoribosylglycinamide formyltransferase 1